MVKRKRTKKRVIKLKRYYRYTKLSLWTDDDFYIGLEIKTHIFTRRILKNAKQIINLFHKEAKKSYDFKNFFKTQTEFLNRRRIAFEESKVSRLEFLDKKFSIITRIVLEDSQTEEEGTETTTRILH